MPGYQHHIFKNSKLSNEQEDKIIVPIYKGTKKPNWNSRKFYGKLKKISGDVVLSNFFSIKKKYQLYRN